MFYTVYRVTNKENGRVYVGKHATEDLDDDYLGSGKLIKAAVRKHGRECFEKEILAVCVTEDEMNALEASIVTEDFVRDPNTYNLIVGGHGGFGFINTNGLGMSSEKGRQMAAKRLAMTPPEKRRELALKGVDALRAKYGSAISPQMREAGGFGGRRHTEESKQAMRQKKLGKFDGQNNPQFGTCWITDGVTNRKVRLDEVNCLPEGWRKGRVLKRDGRVV